MVGRNLSPGDNPSHPAESETVGRADPPGAPKHDFVFQPIAYWAAHEPNRIALEDDEEQLSYLGLEETTNRLALSLIDLGVGPRDNVAVVLPRGLPAILTIIAVLKVGAAYVPLDSEAPIERILNCFEDANPKLAIVDSGISLSGQATADIIGIETFLARAAGQDSDRFNSPPIDPSDLAYVIFTSGSTGRPKGVPITHAALTNFIVGDQEVCIRVERDDKVLQAFSPSSDGHHEEVWPTFLAGATLVVANNDIAHSGADLTAFIHRHEITIISCAPTLLSMVDEDLPSVRRILFGAERCPPEMVRRWWTPQREIINTYGPTEATVGATFAVLHPDEPITIGRELPGYECYVLDDDLKVVLDGEEGELCISGIGVSSGYLGHAATKNANFVPNPFPGESGTMIYRTGDRVRRADNGDLVWLGRRDGQVKIRGHRIELSDVETHIIEDHAIASTVAIVRETASGDPHLVALVVRKPDVAFDGTEFLGRLRAQLPPYMTPHAIEEIDVMPTLPSGKIDRRAAAALVGRPIRNRRALIPPKTEMERRVIAAWQEIFPDQAISATDDFFADLGGHSLVASRFISIVRNDWGLRTAAVREIYRRSTVQACAEYLDELSSAATTEIPFREVSEAVYRKAKAIQGLLIILLYGFQAFLWLTPLTFAIHFAGMHRPAWYCMLTGLLAHAVLVPTALLASIVVKWLVVGRFKPGAYPLWGRDFLKWWFVKQAVSLAPVDHITGTPLAALYLRLMGAKVGKNVHFDTINMDCFDLIEIGDDCVIDQGAWLQCGHVAHGQLVVRPIGIGSGCHIGARSGVSGGARVEDGAVLAELSCAVANMVIPAGEEWHGSPARPREVRSFAPFDPKSRPSERRRLVYGGFQTLALLLLSVVDAIPFLVVSFTFLDRHTGFTSVLLEPVYSVALVFITCFQILLVKWTVLGRVREGEYPVMGTFALRKWISDKHFDLVASIAVPIYDSLLARHWCMALGMKCGPRAEISMPDHMPYDIVEMGSESFIASACAVGMQVRRNGRLILKRTVLADRVFLGNDSVVTHGSHVPRESLLGVLSIIPNGQALRSDPGQAWLGSPPFPLPNRMTVEGFDRSTTYKPTPKLYAERLVREVFRILFPSMAFLLVASVVVNGFVWIWTKYSVEFAMLCSPFLYVLGAVIAAIVVRLCKSMLVGVYKPTVQPLWSRFVWNTETYSVVLHDFAVPLFVHTLVGTPYMATMLRFLGAKVGARAFINMDGFTESDLIEVGDDAAVNHHSWLQAHLFEDRVIKVGRIKIGDRCTVGVNTVVLPDSELKSDAHVGNLSLIMKGETVPSHTYWQGTPAQGATLSLPTDLNLQVGS